MKAARFGRYTKRITILAVTTTVQDDGSPRESTDIVADRWASVEPVGAGREYTLAAQVMADVTIVVEMRYLEGVTPRHRVQYGERTLEIAHVQDIEERGRVTRLFCKEKVS